MMMMMRHSLCMRKSQHQQVCRSKHAPNCSLWLLKRSAFQVIDGDGTVVEQLGLQTLQKILFS